MSKKGGGNITDAQLNWLVDEVRDNRDLLFAPFDYGKGITDEARRKKWLEIHRKCVANDLPYTRDLKHDAVYLKQQVCVWAAYTERECRGL